MSMHEIARLRSSRPRAIELPIAGVEVLELPREDDARGALVELCRATWVEPDEPVQWNAITNRPGSLRGVHWHNAHADFIAPVHGSVLVAAVDLRIGSPTEGHAEVVLLDAAEPRAIVIAAGVGHGFFSAGASVVMYGVSRYWDPDDEHGVRWDDPALGIPWPPEAENALVSGRDSEFPTLAEAGERLTWRGRSG
jgi:dTDP-4-dehydrorhamnose 3,5-epimerase